MGNGDRRLHYAGAGRDHARPGGGSDCRHRRRGSAAGARYRSHLQGAGNMSATWTKNFSKYGWIGYTGARSDLAYSAANISRILFMTTVLYVFMRLWAVVYVATGSDRIGGLSQAQILWYLV